MSTVPPSARRELPSARNHNKHCNRCHSTHVARRNIDIKHFKHTNCKTTTMLTNDNHKITKLQLK